MSTFDNQLLHSVLSGSVADDKARRMPKAGEIGGSGEGSSHSTQDSEDPMSPVPPYEEIEGSQSQQPAALPPPLPSRSQQQLSLQVEGADGMILADSELRASPPDSQTAVRQNSATTLPQVHHPTPYSPDEIPGALNSPPPLQSPPITSPTDPQSWDSSQTPDGKTTFHRALPLYALQRDPAPVDCPRCQKRNLTRLSFNASGATHAWAVTAGVLTVGLAIPAPYLMKGTKNVIHFCPNCNAKLATCLHKGRTEVHCHA